MPITLKIAIFCALSLISGVCYHWGGSDKTWHGKERDIGCSACLIACLWLFRGFSWIYLPVFGLSWSALSCYWKGKAVDMRWWNWALHGLGCGLATLPLLPYIPINNLLCWVIFCTLAMTAVSEFSNNATFEEGMRGLIFTGSSVFLI